MLLPLLLLLLLILLLLLVVALELLLKTDCGDVVTRSGILSGEVMLLDKTRLGGVIVANAAFPDDNDEAVLLNAAVTLDDVTWSKLVPGLKSILL